MFAHNGAIKHRPLVCDKLLLGCGNAAKLIDGIGPKHPWSSEEREKYRLQHLHEGFDTVDLDFSRNPSILMKIGDLDIDISQVFEGRQYKEVYFEGGPEFGSWFLDMRSYDHSYLTKGASIEAFQKHILAITMEDAEIYELTSLSLPPECEPGTKKMTYIRKGDRFFPISYK